MISLSIILPAYNEEKNLPKVINQIIEVVDELKLDAEIIVVDDGSTDKTREVITELEKKHPIVKGFFHEQNKGYGGALISGFQEANKDYIFFMDADGQFDFKEIKKLLPYVNEFDIVAGYRVQRADSLIRKINAAIFNLVVRILFGLKIKDIDCAFKIYKSDAVKNISFETKGALINTEILLKAKMAGARIKQVPVSHYPRLYGEQTGADIKVVLRAFKEILELWVKYKLGLKKS